MMRRHVAMMVAVASATVMLGGCTSPAPLPSGPLTLIEGELPVDDDLVVLDRLPEEYASSAMDLETMEWLEVMQRQFASEPNFGSPSISPDRSTVTIVWFGQASTRLQELIAEAPSSMTVVLQPAAFVPAELIELSQRAVTTQGLVPGVQVAMGGPAPDGSGITIGIVELPAGVTLSQLGTQFAAALQRPDVPVTVEVSGAVMPISG